MKKTMKQIVIPILLLGFFISNSTSAQMVLGLGLKGGANFSSLSFYSDDYTPETILKSHWGAFGRIGYNRVFLQPEAYFSRKGGTFSSDIVESVTSFDYASVDVPLLLGISLINGEVFKVHLLGGPSFSFVTSRDIHGNELLSPEYYSDRYIGFQYGLGAEIWFVTLGARMEHSTENIYSHPSLHTKSQTLMLSVGIKIF